MKRPTSISVIAWFLIVTSVLSLPFTYRSFHDPVALELLSKSLMSIQLQLAFAMVGGLLTIAAGVGMLKGADWSRKLYIGWSILGLIVAFVTSPIKLALIPGTLVLALFIWLLYRPLANAWFSPLKAANDA